MKLTLRTIYLIALFVLPLLAQSQQRWTQDMDDGSIIRIDPATNKATRYSDQGAVQLWDGAHRMQDGSVVIVKDGIVISGGESSPSDTDATPGDLSDQPTSVCIDLVIKVCGFNGECSDKEACSPARQLMKLEADEASQSRVQGANQTAIECRKALLNEAFFPPCGLRESDSKAPTPCQRLVSHVCGDENQCTSDPGCSPARQLLNMEREERTASRDPKRLTYSAEQCAAAMKKSDFFKQCNPAEKPASADAQE